MSSLKGDNLDRDIAGHTTSTERSRIEFPHDVPLGSRVDPSLLSPPSLLTGRKQLQTERKVKDMEEKEKEV